MKTILTTVAGILLTGAVALAYLGTRPTPTPPPPPTVRLTPGEHDFGSRPNTDRITATFTLQNTHSIPVTIGPILKGCACSQAEVTPSTIPANGSAELTVVWNLRGKRGPAKEAVSIPYTGPDSITGLQIAQLTAQVHGLIDPEVNEVPLSAEKPQAEVRFHSPTGRAFQLIGASSNHPSVQAKVLPDGQRIEINFNPAQANWDSGRITITAHSDAAEEPEVKLTVRIGS